MTGRKKENIRLAMTSSEIKMGETVPKPGEFWNKLEFVFLSA
jgi:hypothetical protein